MLYLKEDAALVKIVAIVNVVNLEQLLSKENLREKCKYFPCHNLEYSKYDCRTCYCPFYEICSQKAQNSNLVFDGYILSNGLLACEKCSFIHQIDTVKLIQELFKENLSLNDIYLRLEAKYKEENHGKN